MPQVAPTDAEAATGTKSAQPSAIEDDTDEAVSQAILKQSEMSEQMQAAAIEVAAKAVAKGGWDNEIAARIKKEMDKKFQSLSRGAWHCIVGPDFGSYVTHEAKHFIYFYLPRGLSPQEKAKGGASAQGQQKMARPPPRPAARAARPAARALADVSLTPHRAARSADVSLTPHASRAPRRWACCSSARSV